MPTETSAPLSGIRISPAAAPAAGKGVDYYSYVSGPPFSVRISGPAGSTLRGPRDNFMRANLQIEPADLPWYTFIGTLTWQALADGAPVKGTDRAAARTGNTGVGTMTVMMSTPSTVAPTYALSYGFYDAGAGAGSALTSQDQLYVYLTGNHARWMGDLADRHPGAAELPFHRFALPGAHHAGTFSLAAVKRMLDGPFSRPLLEQVAAWQPAAGRLSPAAAARAVTNLAVTQKDSITTLLNLGIRYLDVRPGNLTPALAAYHPGVRYHHHGPVPGYPWLSLLQDVLVWLHGHPTEVVVLGTGAEGFPDPEMRPTPRELEGDLARALTATGLSGLIGVGGRRSLDRTLGQLLERGTRLIILDQAETLACDSWTSAHATTSPGPVIQALAGMTRARQEGCDYTVLRMHGAATALGAGVVGPAAAAAGDASSPRMSTKGNFDISTNPWLRAHAAKNLRADQLAVLLNDFADNGMVDTAIEVTRQRMEG